MGTREQAVQIIQEMPENKLQIVLSFLQSIVLPKKKPALETVNQVIKDLDDTRKQADQEGWISEEHFFAKYEALE